MNATHHTRLRPGFIAWSVLAAGVAVYEFLAPQSELLSQTVDRGLEAHPVVVGAAIVLTAAHLLNVLDDRRLRWLDPFQSVARSRQPGL